MFLLVKLSFNHFLFNSFRLFIYISVGLTKDLGVIAGIIAGIILVILLYGILRHFYFSSPSSPLSSFNYDANVRFSSLFQFRRGHSTANRVDTTAIHAEPRLKSARPSTAVRPGRFIASSSINRVHHALSGNSPNDGSLGSFETVVHRFSYRDTSEKYYYNPEFHRITSQKSRRASMDECLI